MSHQNNISVGNTVRVRYVTRAGETGRVTSVSWLSNPFRSYARVHINLEGGEAGERSMGDLEKVSNPTLT